MSTGLELVCLTDVYRLRLLTKCQKPKSQDHLELTTLGNNSVLAALLAIASILTPEWGTVGQEWGTVGHLHCPTPFQPTPRQKCSSQLLAIDFRTANLRSGAVGHYRLPSHNISGYVCL